MSKHVGRKQRWQQVDALNYRSDLGRVVHQRNGWFALLDYRTLAAPQGAGELPEWEGRQLRLGPFRRPRNAMVALEQEATVLRNRLGDGVRFGDPTLPGA